MVRMPPTGSAEKKSLDDFTVAEWNEASAAVRGELWLYQDTVGRGELVWGRPGNHRYKVIGRYRDGVFTPWLSN